MLDGRFETTPLHILCIERPASEKQSTHDTSNESLMEIGMGQNVKPNNTRVNVNLYDASVARISNSLRNDG